MFPTPVPCPAWPTAAPAKHFTVCSAYLLPAPQDSQAAQDLRLQLAEELQQQVGWGCRGSSWAATPSAARRRGLAIDVCWPLATPLNARTVTVHCEACRPFSFPSFTRQLQAGRFGYRW